MTAHFSSSAGAKAPTTPEAILTSLCAGLTDHTGLPYACLQLSGAASRLLGEDRAARFPRSRMPGSMTVIARAELPSQTGPSWGEVVLGDVADSTTTADTLALLTAFAEVMGAMFDRAIHRQDIEAVRLTAYAN